MLLCHLWTLTQWRLRASSSNQLESAAALPACTCHRGANMTYCSDCRHQTHLSGGSHCHHSPAPRWAEAGGFLAWSGELRNKYSILQSHAFTLPPEPLSWVLPNSLNWHFLAPSLETEVALIHRPKSSYFCLRGARDAHDSRHHPSLFNGRQNLPCCRWPDAAANGADLWHIATPSRSVFLQRLNLICFLIQHPVTQYVDVGTGILSSWQWFCRWKSQ